MKTDYAKVGIVADGDMAESELIRVFMDVLQQLSDSLSCGSTLDTPQETEFKKRRVESITNILGEIETHIDWELYDRGLSYGDCYFDPNLVEDDLRGLKDTLDSFSPPYVRFGNQKEWGFWVDWDALKEAIFEGSIIAWDNGEYPEDEVRERKEAGVLDGVLEINDHGNATFYDVDGNEIWSVV